MTRTLVRTYIRRTAFYRGALGGRKAWLAVFVFLGFRRVSGRLFGRQERFVALEKLQPGQSMLLTALPPRTRRERRAARRA